MDSQPVLTPETKPPTSVLSCSADWNNLVVARSICLAVAPVSCAVWLPLLIAVVTSPVLPPPQVSLSDTKNLDSMAPARRS